MMTTLTQDKIAALRIARKRVFTRYNHYVCAALDKVQRHNLNLSKAVHELHRYIKRELDGSETLEGWQNKNGIKKQRRMRDRLEWIDWMIACLEEQ